MELCAICQKEYHPRHPREWFCYDCWIKYNKEILSKEPWIGVAIVEEQRRRRNDKRFLGVIFIGDSDLAMVGNGIKILSKFEER
jgi:hypothetical protein